MNTDNSDSQSDRTDSDRLRSAIVTALLFIVVGLAVTQGSALLLGMDSYIEVHELQVNESTDKHSHNTHAINFNYTAHTNFDAQIDIRLLDLEDERYGPRDRGNPPVVETWSYETHIPEGQNNGTHIVRPTELEAGTYQYEFELTVDATRFLSKSETYRTPPFYSPEIESNEPEATNESEISNRWNGSNSSNHSEGSNYSEGSDGSEIQIANGASEHTMFLLNPWPGRFDQSKRKA